MLGQKLVEFAAIFKFGFCVTRKLPNSLHHPLSLQAFGPSLHLFSRQHCHFRLAYSLHHIEKLQNWVLFLEPFEGGHHWQKLLELLDGSSINSAMIYGTPWEGESEYNLSSSNRGCMQIFGTFAIANRDSACLNAPKLKNAIWKA